MPRDPYELALILEGGVGGAVLTLALTLIAAGLNVWRQGWREGTPIVGEGIERAKKRGDL